jgi:diaminohydroxyphosphoribosylaminopyrimidine deaminase/5-amino-6-(5-phosphoribosylamino)uracil reductase
LLRQSGVRRVVVSAIDPNPLVCGKGIEKLRSGGIKVEVGLMREAGERMIEPFACHVRSGYPLVVAKVGMSLDGRIAVPGDRKHWISSEEARSFGQSLRHRMDAILVGIGTILSDDPQLTYRGPEPKTRPLIRAILDSNLRTPAGARVFRADPALPVILFCSARAPKNRQRELREKGAEIFVVPCSNGKLDIRSILKELGRRNVLGLLVEGGSAVHWSFVAAKLVDKFYFNLAPIVLGGSESIPAVGGQGYKSVPSSPRFKIVKHFEAGSDLILETYPTYSRSILSPWRPGASAPYSAQNLPRTLPRK